MGFPFVMSKRRVKFKKHSVQCDQICADLSLSRCPVKCEKQTRDKCNAIAIYRRVLLALQTANPISLDSVNKELGLHSHVATGQ